MPPVQSALFHHHHHQNDHLYHPHPHPQLNSSVTDLKSMSTTVPLPPPPQNTLPNYDSRLLTVTLHAPKKSASEVSSETKSDVGDDDDDQNDDSLLYFHLDRQIEPFGTYELTLVLKSAYSRAQVCSINQWAVSSSASSALNFFSGPSSAASLNLNSKPSSNSRDYQLTVSWTASQVSTSDQQTSSSSSVSTSTSMMTMMMMAANCTFTLYAPFHLFTKLHSVGGAGRKLLEVGLLGATDLINSGGRAVVVRRPELSHHAQHQKMMAKLAVTTLNVAQSDHHVDLGPLGPLPSNLSKKVPSTSVSNIHFKPIHSGRSDQQNSTYPLKANTEQHFLWEFESGGDNDLRTAPLSLANLKRFNLELSFAEAPKSDDDKVPNWKTATFEVRLSTDLSTRYTVREHIEPMAAHHHFSSATLNSNQSSHNTNINNSGKNMSTELLRVGSSCLLRVTIEKVVVVAVKTTNQSETLAAAADDLEDNNSVKEEEEEDDEQIMYELVYDADLWSMVVNSSTNNSGGGGGGGSHPPPYPQQPNHPLHHHHHHPHPHLKHRRNLSSTETTGTLSSLASSTGSAAQPESLGSLSSMTTLTSTNTNTNFSSGYYSLQGTAPCSEQQNKFTSLQQESTTTTANSLSSSSAAVAAAFNVHSKVLRLSSAEPTFEALFEMTPLADGYLPYPSVRLSRYVEQGKSSGPGGGEHARWQTPNFAPRSASPTPKGGSVESVIHGGGGGSSGSNGSGDNLDGTGASKSGTVVEPTTTSSGPLSLSVKNWTAKLLSSSSSLTPSKSSSSHHQYQSLSTGKASSTEQLHQIGNDHHQAGVSSKATPISGKLIAFEPGQVYNYSRAAQIYVLPAAIAAVESSASDSAHSTTMTTQTAHTSSSSAAAAAAAAALSGPMTAVSVASG